MDYVSFPGLGIDRLTIPRVAFTVFGKEIYWYGLIIGLGFLLCLAYCIKRCRSFGFIPDDIMDFGLMCVPCGIVGARLYYVLFSDTQFNSLGEILAVWNGGLAIYGAIIGGAAGLIGCALLKKKNVLDATDLVGPSVLIGQILGRWGNFINMEAYGSATQLPWRMGLSNTPLGYQEVHPTFLYESLWNLLGFVLIASYAKKRKFKGQMTLMYFIWYGFGRMLIEGLRTDSLMFLGLRVSQLLAGLLFAAGLAAYIYLRVRQGKGTLSACFVMGEYVLPEKPAKVKKPRKEEDYDAVFFTEEELQAIEQAQQEQSAAEESASETENENEKGENEHDAD